MASKAEQMRQAVSLGNRPIAFPPGMDPSQAATKPVRLEGVRGDRSSAWISLDRIDRDPAQPREEFDTESLNRLAASLKARGQLQPVRVRWDEGRQMYLILAGERRWRAARIAGLSELQCVIHDGSLAASDALELQLIENCLRDDLKPVEQAKAYRRLMDSRGWSATQLAAELHVHQTSVSRALALLELPETVQEAVEQGALAPSVGYEISKLRDQTIQDQVAAVAVENKLSRQEVAELAQAVRARKPTPAPKPQPVEVDLGDGTVVTVRWRKTNATGALQALRKAAKILQERERDGQAA